MIGRFRYIFPIFADNVLYFVDAFGESKGVYKIAMSDLSFEQVYQNNSFELSDGIAWSNFDEKIYFSLVGNG